jgi:arylsulfatase A-like enzyme
MTPEWKYIYNFKNKTEQLYNIKSDPSELKNLVDEKPDQSNQLKEKLFNWITEAKKYPTKKQGFQLTPKEKEKLEGLGYIQ